MSLYLLGATEAYQLLKMPYLIEHYKTHKQYNNAFKFFYVHSYSLFRQIKHTIVIYQQDMQLPFKSSNRTISLLNFVSLFVPKQTIQPLVLNRISMDYVLFNDKKHLSNPLENIFQPPKA